MLRNFIAFVVGCVLAVAIVIAGAAGMLFIIGSALDSLSRHYEAIDICQKQAETPKDFHDC